MMRAQAEARALVSAIAGPMRLGDNVKGALSRVAEATGLADRRVRGLWNGEYRSRSCQNALTVAARIDQQGDDGGAAGRFRLEWPG